MCLLLTIDLFFVRNIERKMIFLLKKIYIGIYIDILVPELILLDAFIIPW